MIPYGRQNIDQEDIDAVIDVLGSDFITQGPMVPKFELSVSGYCSAKYGVACSNATSALHVACLALGLGPGDSLWTSPITFVASSNCALYCGAHVDFVDIDPQTYNMSVACLTEKLEAAEKQGSLPKVVVPVHYAGQSADMAAIHKLSKEYGFRILEDASHAIGGSFENRLVGGCEYSDITVFSFHPVKIITTGEGGMALTNSTSLAERMQYFRSHGIISDAERMERRPMDEIWNYQQIDLGFNFRMTDIQAALGISQMGKLSAAIEKRTQIAERYNKQLVQLPITLPWQHPDTQSSFHLYPIRVRKEESQRNQREVYDAMRSKDILVNVHYIPVYLQPYYLRLGFARGHCPNAESYYKETITIPLFPTLADEDVTQVIESLEEIFT